MSGKLLKEAGEALYGPRWQSDLARDLNVTTNTLRRWTLSEDALSPYVAEQLYWICQERAGLLDDIAERLQPGTSPNSSTHQ
ncbi:hypothetical protein ACFWYE_04665 [Mesorhizobium sp. NPDC059025]|uniref:hypothetical protein n=1 Tax=Mesorhizobium sp. NPDC059025 TaxID=3346708 RepID=UPI0036C9D317